MFSFCFNYISFFIFRNGQECYFFIIICCFSIIFIKIPLASLDVGGILHQKVESGIFLIRF
ncbi:MAG TPA: hypothetical protein DE060_17910 [Lentisphaeria bacterium]|nr:hypothetical protein [Lentisphaeria bacterium]HCG51068.1 hypothetical protein [Lentisphaeria bacterium]